MKFHTVWPFVSDFPQHRVLKVLPLLWQTLLWSVMVIRTPLLTTGNRGLSPSSIHAPQPPVATSNLSSHFMFYFVITFLKYGVMVSTVLSEHRRGRHILWSCESPRVGSGNRAQVLCPAWTDSRGVSEPWGLVASGTGVNGDFRQQICQIQGFQAQWRVEVQRP